MLDFCNRHYIQINEKGYIVKGFSDAFEQPTANDICIDQEGGRQFALCGVDNPSLRDEKLCYLYKYENNAVRLSTAAELGTQLAEMPPEPPTELELLKDDLKNTKAELAATRKDLEAAQGAIDVLLMQ